MPSSLSPVLSSQKKVCVAGRLLGLWGSAPIPLLLGTIGSQTRLPGPADTPINPLPPCPLGLEPEGVFRNRTMREWLVEAKRWLLGG